MNNHLKTKLYTNTLRMPKPISGNKIFTNVPKDVWTMTADITAKAAANPKNQTREIISLGQGFFSYSPPQFLIAASEKAMNSNALNNQYAPTRGDLKLIDSLKRYYNQFYKKDLQNENILVTTGANEGILACLTGLLNPTDEVIVLEPFFDQYISNIQIPQGNIKYVTIHPPSNLSEGKHAGNDWKINYDELEAAITEKTKILIINTPHNPIGKVFTKEELIKIGDICYKHNVKIISDEVYEQLFFDDSLKFPRIATLDPKYAEITLTVGSFGKAFCATGYRVGYIISENAELLKYAAAAHTRICFSAPHPPQIACAESLDIATTNGYFENMRVEYNGKFQKLMKTFDQLGISYTIPQGTYFIIADFSKLKVPFESYEFPQEIAVKPKDFKLCYWLAVEMGIITIPTSEFFTKETIENDKEGIEYLLRFAVCKTDDYIDKACERLLKLKPYIA
ncbi:hypothetical protein QEN19_003226 [Hanseniaspora menglaensis]